MFKWFSDKFYEYKKNLARRDIDNFLDMLKGTPKDVIGMLIVIATEIKLDLIEENLLGDTTLENELENQDVLVSLYNVSKLSKLYQKSNNFEKRAALMVWHHSLRGIIYPEIAFKVKEMWIILKDCFPYTEESLKDLEFLLNINTSKSNIIKKNLKYIPKKYLALIEENNNI